MPTRVTTSIAQVHKILDSYLAVPAPKHSGVLRMIPKLHWLLLMILTVASAVSAQRGPTAQRPQPTINKPGVAAESDTLSTSFKRCSEVEPDASYLIPRAPEYGFGRTEASGSGAYGYKPAGSCRYWIVDFLMNRFSNTRENPFERIPVFFYGDAFDLPSSDNAGDTRPIVEEDCKRLEIDVLMYRKDPNENIFRPIMSVKGRFASWDSTNKRCFLNGVPVTHSERAPTSNMLKIRIAVRVKLRGSWQQAAGYSYTAPPN